MNSFGDQIYFRKNWRSYQARVLSDLETHLDDNHLHIVAAPGSGKTVLGLEVVRRLGKPAVIFSPTLTIRDQWGERFTTLFCPQEFDSQPCISKSLDAPKLLTLSSYQGLHSAFAGQDGKPDDTEEESDSTKQKKKNRKVDKNRLIKQMKEFGVGTIVLDESHHLRNEWWKCLLELKRELDNPTIVALTATPPVDVNPWEWERYQKMCGPIDSEINVPELVREKNLCPHQDYVYFSCPTQQEKRVLKAFREDTKRIYRQICKADTFIEALKSHPYVNEPEQNLDQILEDASFFSAIIVFVWHVQRKFPKKLMRVLGVSGKRIPKLNYEWMEILLAGCLYRHADTFESGHGLPDQIIDTLKRIGAIEKRAVQLRSNASIKKLLSSSLSKLGSIRDIAALEGRALGDELRMVILTDYIRKADLPKTIDDTKPIKRIGVVPIFEVLRREQVNARLGVLSGSLVIIPEQSVQQFKQISQELSIENDRIRITPLSCDSDYVLIESSGTTRAGVIKAVTELFNHGGIEVLVGTKSLLGEGWDAPSINSLILASFVGSYMLSNQMRGRAIRTQEGHPEKTSNIWHLVCIEKGADESSDDYAMLKRRFKSYVGVSFYDTSIQNGLGRVVEDKPPFSSRKLSSINEMMITRALDRGGMQRRWTEAFAANETAQMIEELQSPFDILPKSLIFGKTIKALIYDGLFLAGMIMSYFQISFESGSDSRAFFILLCVIFGLPALIISIYCLKALYLFIKYGPVSCCIQKIGRALLESLAYTGDIKTPINKMGVKVEQLESGYLSCSLSGATTYEKALFLDAMQEILDPIQNPRYLLVRLSALCGLIRKDYHAVPALLGRRKETAEFFAIRWKKYLGAGKLIYTRSVKGRHFLVKARSSSLSFRLQKRSERVNSWK
ncbi:MAG: DEAD/DEAH box helicase family protein [Planctomycetota bacterium]